MTPALLRGLRWGMLAALTLAFLGALALLTGENYNAGATFWMLAASTVLLAVPLGLLFGAMGLVGWVALGMLHERGSAPARPAGPTLGRATAAFLYRAPRIAGVLMAVFISLFALDVFEMPGSAWELLLAFLIHAAPAIALAVVVALAWRWEWVGAAGFLVAALYFIRFATGGGDFSAGIMLIFFGPLAATALLWWVNWAWRSEVRMKI